MPNSGWFNIRLLDPGSLSLAYNSYSLLAHFFFSQKQGGRHCAHNPALRTQSVWIKVFQPARGGRMPVITVDQINKIIERCFKTQELDKPVIDHVLMLVNRHVEACKRYGTPPVIARTVIEAVEDYRLKEATGFSVIDRAPDETALPMTRFLQYLSPRESRSQKREE